MYCLFGKMCAIGTGQTIFLDFGQALDLHGYEPEQTGVVSRRQGNNASSIHTSLRITANNMCGAVQNVTYNPILSAVRICYITQSRSRSQHMCHFGDF